MPPARIRAREVVRPGAARYAESTPVSWPAVTQQYLVGELSSLLGDLQRAPGGQLAAIRKLRREVECSPLQLLPRLARQAMNLSDVICWVALEQGDVGAFRNCAEIAVALGEFTYNARLLGE